MGFRHWLGGAMRATIGPERTERVRASEQRVRQRLATRLAGGSPASAPAPAAPKAAPSAASGWRPSDPFASFPKPPMTRHELLTALHEQLAPRRYFEIGVNDGQSLVLSRTRSIGVDPAFKVTREIHCDVQLVRATSDDFFARDDAFAHFDGEPIDLAFIDGMHLAEFAFRDFVNVEAHLARTAVVVFDDVLPRNGLEAARDRATSAWAGDVYKSIESLLRRRPDLAVLLVNTAPTGTAVIVGVDPDYACGEADYLAERASLESPDPQRPPQEWLERTIAVDPEQLLELPVWGELARLREQASPDLAPILAALRALPTIGGVPLSAPDAAAGAAGRAASPA